MIELVIHPDHKQHDVYRPRPDRDWYYCHTCQGAADKTAEQIDGEREWMIRWYEAKVRAEQEAEAAQGVLF